VQNESKRVIAPLRGVRRALCDLPRLLEPSDYAGRECRWLVHDLLQCGLGDPLWLAVPLSRLHERRCQYLSRPHPTPCLPWLLRHDRTLREYDLIRVVRGREEKRTYT